MIKLVLNEFKKMSKSKILLSSFFITTVVCIIKYVNSDTLLDSIFTFIPFIGVLVCILFGGIVSNEFQNGTIRIYLTKPYKRWKILLSKLILIYIIIIYLLIFLLFAYFIANDFVIIFSYIKEVCIHFVPVFFLGTLTLFLSVLTNNTAVSVGLSILICLVSNILAQVFFGFGYTVFEYTFLPYIDYSIFKDSEYLLMMKNELGVNLSISNGNIVLLLYSIFFIVLSLNIFNKKDIKN